MQINNVLKSVPRYRLFPTVSEIHRRVRELSHTAGFSVRTIGKSESGFPIHHVKFGKGRIKALFSAYPHPNEPIGGLTVLTLMSLLRRHHPTLVNLPVEWHFIPCPDPDGVLLNEGWMRKPFTFERYM